MCDDINTKSENISNKIMKNFDRSYTTINNSSNIKNYLRSSATMNNTTNKNNENFEITENYCKKHIFQNKQIEKIIFTIKVLKINEEYKKQSRIFLLSPTTI